MKELKNRTLEVAICIEEIIILVLISIVVYYITQSIYSPYDVNKDGKVNLGDVSETYNYYKNGTEYNEFDLNFDGQVDITDVLISVDNTNAIRDYILNEN